MNKLKNSLGLGLMMVMLLPVAAFAEGNMKVCGPGANFNFMTGEKCPTATTTSTPTVSYNATCASTAVIAEENSMQALQDTFQASMKTAAMARRDALGAAFLLTDTTARNTAIKAARDTFQTAQKTAQQTMMTAQKTLMDSFKTTMQGCGVTGDGMMMQGQGGDQGEGMGMMGGDQGNSMMGQANGDQGKDVKKPTLKPLPKPMINRSPKITPPTQTQVQQ